MPTQDDLVGIGFPAQMAAILGNKDTITACTGTTQGAAALIKSHMPELTTAGGQTAAIFNANAIIGTPHYVFVSTATSALVFPPVGQTMNGALNNSVTVPQNKLAIFVQYKKGFWHANLSS